MSKHKAPILIINCGSSSIKFALIEPSSKKNFISGLVENINQKNAIMQWKNREQKKQQRALSHVNHEKALQAILSLLDEQDLLNHLEATAHRVVHGGSLLTEPVLAEPAVLKQIERCIPLAPLHNGANLQGLQIATQLLPKIPHIALFDTAFHKSIPQVAHQYAIPWELSEQLSIKKYGFHGLSYDYLLDQTAKALDKQRWQCNLVICHLGNGASICGIKEGVSVEVSMGMTPLAGIMMGTRSGDIDPGVIPYIMQETGKSTEEVITLLTKESGLLGVSGMSHDMRDIITGIENNDPKAKLALDMMAYQIAKTVSGYQVAIGNMDALVFSGGIGENTPELREKIIEHLHFLGLKMDHTCNQNNATIINTSESKPIFVIKTDEETQMALLSHDLLRRLSPCAPS